MTATIYNYINRLTKTIIDLRFKVYSALCRMSSARGGGRERFLMVYPNLLEFFGGYFHQDWDLEDANPDDVIRRFQSSEPRENVEAVIDELNTLLSSNLNEEELQTGLLLDLQCCYDPRVDWADTTSWLKHVRDLLNRDS